jgi:hypothetical protein
MKQVAATRLSAAAAHDSFLGLIVRPAFCLSDKECSSAGVGVGAEIGH